MVPRARENAQGKLVFMLYIDRLEEEDQAHAAGAKERRCSIGLEQRLSFAPAAWARRIANLGWGFFGSNVIGCEGLVPGEQGVGAIRVVRQMESSKAHKTSNIAGRSAQLNRSTVE